MLKNTPSSIQPHDYLHVFVESRILVPLPAALPHYLQHKQLPPPKAPNITSTYSCTCSRSSILLFYKCIFRVWQTQSKPQTNNTLVNFEHENGVCWI